jgi:hypothetical protein
MIILPMYDENPSTLHTQKQTITLQLGQVYPAGAVFGGRLDANLFKQSQ